MLVTYTLIASILLAATQALGQEYTVRNLCPTPIEWVLAGQSQGTLATGASVVKKNLGTSAGFFYTTANGGVTPGGQLVAARAGFFFEPNYWYYYLVRDTDSKNFNTGISIKPSSPANNGFCTTAACLEGNCTTAFRYPPVFHGGPPPANQPAPSPPNYQCKVPGTNFEITFCPGGNWPQVRGAPIFPGFNTKKCIDVRGGVLENGTPVQIYDCNDSNAQRWFLSYGSTKVQLGGTNFCLDAGSTPGNGVQLKIWQCYDNLPAQQWYMTDDSRIALEGKGLCLDLPDGNLANANVLQTWACADFNNNQVWAIPDIL